MSKGRHGPPDNQCLLGQEVRAIRSDGKWHEAIITDIHVQFPDVCSCQDKWEEGNYIKVAFGDGMTATIKTKKHFLDIADFIGPVEDPPALVKRRCKELYERHRKQEEVTPWTSFREALDEGGEATQEKRKAEDDNNQRNVKPRKDDDLHTKTSDSQEQQEKLVRKAPDDSDAEDDMLLQACIMAEQQQATSSTMSEESQFF